MLLAETLYESWKLRRHSPKTVVQAKSANNLEPRNFALIDYMRTLESRSRVVRGQKNLHEAWKQQHPFIGPVFKSKSVIGYGKCSSRL